MIRFLLLVYYVIAGLRREIVTRRRIERKRKFMKEVYAYWTRRQNDNR